MQESKKIIWVYWLLVTGALVGYLIVQLLGDDKTVYLPGKTSHGHHQIEMACTACHTDPMGGKDVLQDACMNCHAQELATADDSHPKSKFTNPRNADSVAKLDARACVTCHTEHQEDITLAMGVTVPEDFCFKCHEDVAENRPSHKGMSFLSCATGGCHNFHDNRALYEDFLAKHIDEPAHKELMSQVPLSLTAAYQVLESYPLERYPIKPVPISNADRPISVRDDPKVSQDWADTAHRDAGVNCTACHEQKISDSAQPVWIDRPTHEVCMTCHTDQTKGFLAGKHGMRLAQELSPMTPARARVDMKKSAAHKELSCVSCHSAHRFDTKHAAVEACLSCHDDTHSLAYKQSSHFNTWHKEMTGMAKPNSGVSCATCHMPRKPVKYGDGEYIIVEHNQNDNLRPNEKMLRSVCMDCHGLGFAIDALADRKLIETNFSDKPSIHVESLDLVKQRLGLKKDANP